MTAVDPLRGASVHPRGDRASREAGSVDLGEHGPADSGQHVTGFHRSPARACPTRSPQSLAAWSADDCGDAFEYDGDAEEPRELRPDLEAARQHVIDGCANEARALHRMRREQRGLSLDHGVPGVRRALQ